MPTPSTSPTTRRTGAAASVASRVPPTVWLAAGIVLTALNLRVAVTSVGALLDQLQRVEGMSSAVAGVVTTLPVICFAVIGSQAAALARRVGEHVALVLSLGLFAAGLVIRVLTPQLWVFLCGTVVALAGCAVGNILLPSVVKRHFPQRLGSMTAAYTTAMAVGTALAAAVTVPAAHAAGTWRAGLGVWTLLVLAAILPWLGVLRTVGAGARARNGAGGQDVAPAPRPVALRRSPLAWALMTYFATQSVQAYVMFGWLARIFADAGLSEQRAAWLLTLVAAAQIPVSVLLPMLAGRMRSQRPLVVAPVLLYLVGYLGLLAAPRAAPWLWALLPGLASGAFPLALTLITLRSRTAHTTAALSGFTQSTGYLAAGCGPLLVGVLHGLTGEWTVPFAPLFAMLALNLCAGWYAARDRHIEDQLGDEPAARPAPAG